MVAELFTEFRPIVQSRMNIRIMPERDYGFFVVDGVEPTGKLSYDFGETISGGKESEGLEFDELYMGRNELAQWRIWLIDDIEINLNLIGRSATRGSTKYDVTTAYSFSMDTNHYDSQSQFFTFQDEKIFFDVKNPTQTSISQERVVLMGFKYSLTEIDVEKERKPDRWTDVPMKPV